MEKQHRQEIQLKEQYLQQLKKNQEQQLKEEEHLKQPDKEHKQQRTEQSNQQKEVREQLLREKELAAKEHSETFSCKGALPSSSSAASLPRAQKASKQSWPVVLHLLVDKSPPRRATWPSLRPKRRLATEMSKASFVAATYTPSHAEEPSGAAGPKDQIMWVKTAVETHNYN
ncbi:hypothetical protein BGX20_000603, partial [Mortierella sp. AD010]